MRLPPNTPIFEFSSEKLGIIKIRRINTLTYAKIYDAFSDIDSAAPEELVRYLFSIVGYWPDSLDEKGEFQDKGTVGKRSAAKLTEDELESFAGQIVEKDDNLPYSQFIIASNKQYDKPKNDELDKKENESNVEYLYRLIAIKAKENKAVTEKFLKAAMPFSIDEVFPKSSLDSIKSTLTASEQLRKEVEKMNALYDPSSFSATQSAFESIKDSLAHADQFKNLAETTRALNESHNQHYEPPFINHAPLKIPPNPIDGTNKRLDSLLDHQKEAVKLTAKSATLLTKMNESFLGLIGDLRVGGKKTLIVAGLTLFVTLLSLGYAIYTNKQSSASSVAMIESMKTLNDGMQEFLGQQNSILKELQNQNGNDATSQQMLGELIEINKDMKKSLQEQNGKPDQLPEPAKIKKSNQ